MKESRGWRVGALAFGVFALVFGFLTITSFNRQSPTIDEPVHLLGGYSYLKWGDFRVNPEHPPLVKIWAAFPLFWLAITDPRPTSPTWNQILATEPGGPVYPLAQDMFYVLNDGSTLFFYAKIQMVVVSIVLAAFVYIWSRELFGIQAAIVSVFLYGLDPNILAHSPIIHTDLPFAACFFIGTYFLWRALTEFTVFNLLSAAVTFGLAAITKHSFISIVPVWIILGTIKIFSSEPQRHALIGGSGVASNRKQKMVLFSGLLFCSMIAAYLCIWLAYGFRFNAVPGSETSLFMTQSPAAQKPLVAMIQSVVFEHRLLPEALISGYLYNLKIWKHSAYLLGEISDDGFWSYFPVVFAVKTPLPTLLLLALSAGFLLLKKRPTVHVWLIIPPLVYFALAVLSRFNLGVRHLLPVYPFLFVLIGGTVEKLWRDGSRVMRGSLVLLGVWYLGSALSSYPHYLSYFNELAGGPRHGHNVLLDSNLDWGQDLKGLKEWMDANAVKKIQLFYFGTAQPKYYGIDDFYSPENLTNLKSADNASIALPQYLAISANFRYGKELFLPKELSDVVASYQFGQPVTTIGHSILVYQLNLADGRIYENAGILAERKGALHMAIALFGKALQVNPSSANAHQSLARALAQQGKIEEARRHYQEALRILRQDRDAPNPKR